MKTMDKAIKVGIIYNAFDPSDMQRSELVYRKNAMLKTYLNGLPTDCDWLVGVNGVPVDLKKDGKMKLKASDHLTLVVVPHGGNGVKSVLRIVATIALAAGAAAVGFAIGGPLGAAAAAAIVIGGTLIINAVLAPKQPKADVDEGESYGYDGAKNTAKQGVAVPVVYGKYRVAGNYVDLYTQNIGDDQYLYGRTVLSDGPIQNVTLPMLNDQPIDNYLGVDWGFTTGGPNETVNPYFNRNTTQIQKSSKLTAAWTTHTTTNDVDQLQVNIQFTRGLVEFDDKGKKKNRSASIAIEISEAGKNNWRGLGSSYVNAVTGDIGGASTPSTTKLSATVTPTVTDDTKSTPYAYVLQYKKTGDANWTTFKTVSAYSSNAVFTATSTNWDQVNNNAGTYKYSASPDIYEWSVPEGTYQIRVTGQGSITAYGYSVNAGGQSAYTYSDNRAKVLRKTIESGKLAAGKYDIRIRKTSAEGDNEKTLDEIYLADIGEIVTTGITMSHIANAYYKVKMTEQLNSVPSITWLVEGVKMNKYDLNGTVTEFAWSDNPAWIVLDMLIGAERGAPGIYAIDYPMFVEWAEHCETNGLKFNGVFDTTQTLWDTCQDVLKIGHASFSRVGTKLSLTIDRIQEPVMLFGPGNIFKDSFKINYLPMTGRANEFELSYFDTTDDNKQKTIRIVDPDADNRGDIPRPVSFSMVGIDNFEQAQKEAWYQLYNNRYLRRTITFDAPIESIGLAIGDVALIQHDMMDWGTSGRVGIGSTSTVVNIDKLAEMEAGNNYSLLVIHDTRNLAAGDTANTTGITGNYVTLANINNSSFSASQMKRLVVGNVDYEILDGNVNPMGTNGWPHSVNLALNKPFVKPAVSTPVIIYDTDVVEERDVVFKEGKSAIVTVTTPFSQAPNQFVNYMFGVKEIVKKPYRLKSLNGTGFDQRSLTFIEYNPAIYNPPETIVPFPPTTLPRDVRHVTEVQYNYNLRATDANTAINGVLSWNAGNISNYGGVDVYVGLNGSDFVFNKTVLNSSECQLDFHFNDSVKIRVVAFNTTLVRAPIGTAPFITLDLVAGPAYLGAPTGIIVDQVSYLALGLVEASWNPPVGDLDLPIKFRVQTLQEGKTEWDEYGVTSENFLRIGDLTAANYTIRIRSERGESYSSWASNVFGVGTVPGQTIQPGATVGAPAGTMVGPKTVEQLLQDIKDAANSGGGGPIDSTPPGIPTGLVLASVLTDNGVDLTATWTTNTEGDIAGYDVSIKQGTGGYIDFATTSAVYKFTSQPRNTTFTVRVRAWDQYGNRSGWSGEVAYTTVKDTVPPAIPTSLVVDATYETAFVNFTAPSDADVASVTVTLSLQSNNSLVDTKVISVRPGGKHSAIFINLSKSTGYYVQALATDTSGNTSVQTGGVTFTTAGGINLADFTPGLTGIVTVQSLPNPSGYTGATTVFNQADGRLYNYVNGAWISAVDTTIANGSISTEKLVDGVITPEKIGFTIGGGNLVRNSGMENATWQTGIGLMAAGFAPYSNTDSGDVDFDVQANGRNGGKSQLVRWNKNTTTKGIYLLDSAGVNNLGLMKPNSKYVFTFYALIAGAGQGYGIGLRWNTAPTVTMRKNPAGNGTWQRYEYLFVTGANVDTNIFITTDYIGPNAGYFYIDDIQLEEGTVATAYAPALLPGEITGDLIAPLAIDTSKLKDAAITDAKIASISAPKLTGQLTDAQLSAISAAKIAGQLSSSQLAAIEAAKITGQLSASQIAAIEAAKITGQLTDAQVASIAAAKLTGQITSTQITDNSISTPKLATGSVVADKIAAGSIVADKIAAGAVNADKIAANSINSGHIVAGSILAEDIAANTITGDKIAAKSITSANIVAGTIGALEIAAGQITTEKLASNSVTADKIVAGSILAEKIAAGQITAEKIAAGSISADKLTIGIRGQNLVVNGSGETRTTAGWRLTEGNGAPNNTFGADAGNGAPTFRVNKANKGEVFAVAPQPIPVLPGHTYVARMNYWGSENTTSGMYFRMYAGTNQDNTGTAYNYNLGFENVGVSAVPYTPYEAIWTAPAGIFWAHPAIYSWSGGPTGIAFNAVEMFEQVTSAVIADGAITTNKMVANTIIGDRIKAGTLAADKIIADSITADQIAANAITVNELAANAVTANKIAVNAVTANAIAANAITAEKILIKSTGGALNADPNFIDKTIWNVDGTAGGSFVTINYGIAGNTALRLSTSGIAILSNDFIPVDRNKQYRFHVWAHRLSGSVGGIYAGVALYDANGANINGDGSYWKYVAAGANPDGSWTKYEAPFGLGVSGYEFPANARTMAICLFGNYNIGQGANSVHEFQDARIEEVLGSTLIADGAITTNKMIANSISGDRIAANTLNADRIISNSITAGKLSIQTKPISMAGVNLRWDNDNVVRWDSGTISYPDTSGQYITKNVDAGGIAWAGWDKPVTLCFHSGLASSTLAYVYFAADLAGQTEMIPVATWNRSGSDLSIKSGVSTLVNGDRIVTGSIQATKIVASSITATQIAGGTITGDKLVAGTITAAQIAAGAITADRLLVSSMTNLNPDPGFRDTTFWVNNGVYNGPLGTNAGSVPAWYNIHGSDINGVMGTTQYAMLWSGYFTGAGRQHLFSARRKNIRGNTVYQLSAFANNQTNQNFTALIRFFDVNDAYISDAAISWNAGEVTTNKSIQFTAPAGVNSWYFIVYNAADRNYDGHFEISNLQVVEAIGATTILNGAITTDKITVNSLNGDRIQVGSLSADKITAGTVLSNTITVSGTTGNIGDAITASNNASNNAWYCPNDGYYTFLGNKITKTLTTDWDRTAYTKEYYTGSCMMSGVLSAPGVFIGLDSDRANNNYGGYDYAWHRSDDGTASIWVNGGSVANAGAYDSIGGNSVTYSVIYDGKSVRWYRNEFLHYEIGTSAGRQFAGLVGIYRIGGYVSNARFDPTTDNSLYRTDPAARVNANTTQIDPGKILISGATTLANWRFGGDTTLIGGGSIAANTIAANKLTIGNRGLSVLGVTFEWNPLNNYVSWTEGYFYYQDDNNNPRQTYVAAGNTGGQAAHMYFYWTKDSGTITISREVLVNDNTIMVASWWGGANLNVNFGNTIINGDRITTNTINANKITAGTITGDKIAGGTITGGLISAGTIGADRLVAGSITASQIAAGSISADRLVAGSITSAQIAAGAITADKLQIGSASGARLSLVNNLISGYYDNGQLSFRLGTW